MDAEQLKAAREERDTLIGRAQTLAADAKKEGRDLTEPEKQEFDSSQNTIDELGSTINDAENEHRQQRLDAQIALASKPQSRAVPAQSHADRLESGDVQVFDDGKYGRSRTVPHGFESRKQAFAAGQWIKAQLKGNQKARDWCGWNLEQRVLTEGTAADGGFLVPDEFEAAIILLRDQFGVARRECQVVSMGSDVRNFPKWTSSPDAAFYPETSVIADGDMVLEQVQCTAQKLGRLSRVTNELFDDSSIDLASFLAEDFARAFASMEDNVWINGDNTTAHGGIHGIAQQFDDNTNLVGAITASAADDTFGALLLADFMLLPAAAPDYVNDNAKWFISQAGFAASMQSLAMAAGTNINDYERGLSKMFAGYPVVITNRMPNGPTTDYTSTAMVLFGDMRKASLFADRNQIRLQVLTELYAGTYETGIIATERFDIQNHSVGTTVAGGEGAIVALIGGT